MTNFERIKNMSKKEMARFLNKESAPCGCCIYRSYEDCRNNDCEKGIKKWLKQEADND